MEPKKGEMVKCTLEESMKAQRGSGVAFLLFLYSWCWVGVGGQNHISVALLLLKRPGAHLSEGWVGPRAGLDKSGLDPWVVQLVVSGCT